MSTFKMVFSNTDSSRAGSKRFIYICLLIVISWCASLLNAQTTVCPTIGSVIGPSGIICEGGGFGAIALGLADFDEEVNNDQTYGIRFVAFVDATDDPYTGGTDLGTVPFLDFTNDGAMAVLPATATLPVGTYTIYGVLSPVPEDETCRPAASGTVTVAPAPDADLDVIQTVSVADGLQTGLSGGTPIGGVYSGNGVTDDGNGMTYTFDPVVAGVGSQIITYTFTDANGCTDTTIDATVVTAPPLPGDSCEDAYDISSLTGQAFNLPQTSVQYNNSNYTTGEDDPNQGFDCFYDNDGWQSSVWYSFTGDGNTYRIRSVQCDGPDENLDLQAAVYSGSCDNLTNVTCNEDEDLMNILFNFSVEFATENGVNYLVLVDGLGSMVGAYCLEVTNLDPTNVTDLAETEFRIYPNPTAGIIQLPDLKLDRVEAYDAAGRRVLHLNRPENTLDLTAQTAGLYLLKMYSGEQVYTAKVTKS